MAAPDRPLPPLKPHAHLPWGMRREHLDWLVDRGIPPEIAFTGPDLDRLSATDLRSVRRRLEGAGLAPLIHAPFVELNPGARDPLIAGATRTRLEQTLKAAEGLGAELIVSHPGFERWQFGHDIDLWLTHSLAFWPPLLERAGEIGCRLALENVFDHSPEPLRRLLAELDCPWLGHCFDIGHWNLFVEGGLGAWFDALGSRMRHLHLHDNHGDRDAHMALGQGSIDFAELRRQVLALPSPPTITLEAHRREDLSLSLTAFAALFPDRRSASLQE